MKQILIIGMIALLTIFLIGAGTYALTASQDSEVETPKTCGSCNGNCNSEVGCGQAGCQLKDEESCGCAKRT